MKKLVTLLLSLALVLSLAACGGEATPDASDDAPASSQNEESTENDNTENQIVFEEVVAIDNAECAVKITEIDPDNMWGYTLKAQLENKSTEKTYMFSVESASINGVQCDPMFASEVAAGKKANEEINFSTDTLEENGIVEYTDIELTFKVYDSNDWSADPVGKETIHVYPYGEENAVAFVREAQATLGDRKTAMFFIMSDTDDTFNFLISMAYTQLFNLLCEKADDVYGGRLPVHVRCLIDEAANIGQIPRLEKLVATIRSRELSCCLVLQAQSQLKALYKDNCDTIIGNMDARIFLGGSEPTTLKELSAALGKETIDMYNTSVTKGTQESHGQNFQKLGKELASVDELAVLDGSKCILQLRGVRPFLSDKYDITKHPNYKYLSDFDKKNAFNIERFLSTKLKPKPGERFEAFDITMPDGEAAPA